MSRCHQCGTPLPAPTDAWVPYAEALQEAGWDIRVRAAVQTCPHCGETYTGIARSEDLHQLLAARIADQPADHPLHPAEIRFLRAHLRLSGRDLAGVMGVDEATVSRWLSGARPPSSGNDRHLRLLARLGPERVRALCEAAPSEPPGPVEATLERGAWALAPAEQERAAGEAAG